MTRAVSELLGQVPSDARRSITQFGKAAWLVMVLVASPFSTSADSGDGPQLGPGTATTTTTADDQLSPRTVRLWEGPAPGSRGNAPQDIPTLTIFRPQEATAVGTAVIIAPAGGYQELESHQARQAADWFSAHGVTAFVLSYRLISHGYLHPSQLNDAHRAIRWVRAHASEFKVSRDRIGMIGFSAGGHLTGMAETVFDAGDPTAADPVERVSSRPDFAILAYAGLVFGPNDPTPTMFAGPGASAAAVRQTMPSINVTPQTPPTFIFQTTEDQRLPATNATEFYDALFAAKVPVEAHIFERGEHGVGLDTTDPALGLWPLLLQNWLAERGLLKPLAHQSTR